jgi:hypothetical protein
MMKTLAAFWAGVVCGGGILMLLAALAGVDTVSDVTKRGFYTHNQKLYVVRAAEPSMLPR